MDLESPMNENSQVQPEMDAKELNVGTTECNNNEDGVDTDCSPSSTSQKSDASVPSNGQVDPLDNQCLSDNLEGESTDEDIDGIPIDVEHDEVEQNNLNNPEEEEYTCTCDLDPCTRCL